jgi:hypothetical protein
LPFPLREKIMKLMRACGTDTKKITSPKYHSNCTGDHEFIQKRVVA